MHRACAIFHETILSVLIMYVVTLLKFVEIIHIVL